MNTFVASLKPESKKQNDDYTLLVETAFGSLFLVLDFAQHNVPSLDLKLDPWLRGAIQSLESAGSLSPEMFLGILAREINNEVYNVGKRFAGGLLHATAAIALIRDDRLYYFTYGDARVNIWRGSRLLLLNGAKYNSPIVVGLEQSEPEGRDEDPQQMGRQYWEEPIAVAPRWWTLSDCDCILIFSDGLEERCSPQRCLAELQRLTLPAEPSAIGRILMAASSSSQDDRTLIVICGPYNRFPDRVIRIEENLAGSLAHKISELREGLRVDAKANIAAESSALTDGLMVAFKRYQDQLSATQQSLIKEGIQTAVADLQQSLQPILIDALERRSNGRYVNRSELELVRGQVESFARESSNVLPRVLADMIESPLLEARIREAVERIVPQAEALVRVSGVPAAISTLGASVDKIKEDMGRAEANIRQLSDLGEQPKPHVKESDGLVAVDGARAWSRQPADQLILWFSDESPDGVVLLKSGAEAQKVDLALKRKELSLPAVRLISAGLSVRTRVEAANFLEHHRTGKSAARSLIHLPEWARGLMRWPGYLIGGGILLVVVVSLALTGSRPHSETWTVEGAGREVILRFTNNSGAVSALSVPTGGTSVNFGPVTFRSFEAASQYLSTQIHLEKPSPPTGPLVKLKPEVASDFRIAEVPILTGDSLGKIATRYHTTIDILKELNPDVKPESLIAGKKLKAPEEHHDAKDFDN